MKPQSSSSNTKNTPNVHVNSFLEPAFHEQEKYNSKHNTSVLFNNPGQEDFPIRLLQEYCLRDELIGGWVEWFLG